MGYVSSNCSILQCLELANEAIQLLNALFSWLRLFDDILIQDTASTTAICVAQLGHRLYKLTSGLTSLSSSKFYFACL
jgi:hypothetical protein